MNQHAFNKIEKGFIKELTTGIAMAMLNTVGQISDIPEHPEYLHHKYESYFESGCDVLWRLGLAVAGFEKEDIWEMSYKDFQASNWSAKYWPPYFRVFALQDIASNFSFSAFPILVDLDLLISTYLNLAPGLGRNSGDCLPYCFDEPFSVNEDIYGRILAYFSLLDYVVYKDEHYIWTDKIAPIMLEDYNWDADSSEPDHDNINIDLIASQVQIILDIGLEDFPACTRMNGVSTDTMRGMMIEIMTRWNGAEWVERKSQIIHCSYDEAAALAKRILKHFRQTSMPSGTRKWERIPNTTG